MTLTITIRIDDSPYPFRLNDVYLAMELEELLRQVRKIRGKHIKTVSTENGSQLTIKQPKQPTAKQIAFRNKILKK